MTITINQGMLAKIRDDWEDGWEGEITFSIDVDYSNVFQDVAQFFGNDPAVVATNASNYAPLIELVELWDDLILRNITYAPGDEDASITINTVSNMPEGADGYCYSTLHVPLMPNDADVFLEPDAIVAGGGRWRTAMHEFGHALGLEHPGDYDASEGPTNYAEDAEFLQDTGQFSIMSYFNPVHYNPLATWSRGQALTPMIYDILAIQQYYGVDTTTRLGDTTYGFNSTAGRAVFAFQPTSTPTGATTSVFTIWDAGGAHDRLDASGYRHNQHIDLREGSYSNIGGLVANIGIAFGTFIEDAIGGTGDDRVLGNQFANEIDGGLGADNLTGGDGNDTLTGGLGNDDVFGDNGNDVLTGGNGGDSVFGGSGFDIALYSATAGETITIRSIGNPANGRWDVTGAAQAGGDSLSSIEGFRFGSGNDRITISGGATTISLRVDAAGGNDTVIGSPDAADVDILIGGAGTDRVETRAGVFNAYGGVPGSDPDTWFETPSHNDLLVMDRSSYGADYRWTGSWPVPLGIYIGTDNSTARGFARLDYRGTAFMDSVTGFIGNDTIEGGNGNDGLEGRDGNDILRGGLGLDSLWGGNGDDYIETGGGGESANFGEAGSDTMVGTADAEWFHAGTGGDSVMAGAGRDNIHVDGTTSDGGNDTVNAGADDDFVATYLGVESIDGGAGFDTIHMDRSLMMTGVTFFLNGPAGSDGTRVVGFETMYYVAGRGNDLIRGHNGAESIVGSLGNDTLEGGAGNDALDGGDGNDVLRGGAGLDFLYGRGGNDRIETGGGGDQEVFGEAGNDTITGAAEGERLLGGEGNDLINAGGGSDSLHGEAGRDTLNGGDGNDYISSGPGTGRFDGGAGVDTLFIDRFTTTLGVKFTLNGAAGSDGTLGVNFESLTYQAGSGNDSIRGHNGEDFIGGYGGRDTLDGGGGNDGLRGGDGNDIIRGGLGNDTSIGEAGNDSIDTGGGNDTVNGGAGNDTVTGQAGAESVSGGGDNDLIQTGAGADFLAGDDGNDTLIAGTENDNVYGGNGDDTLNGGAGNDYLNGGAGRDRFVMQAAPAGSNDAIAGFTAADDVFALDNAVFTTLAAGPLVARAFHLGAAAADQFDRVIYNAATGALLYDRDGTGAAGAIQFATFYSAPVGGLTNADFIVI